jgi:DNA-binding transcriptional LysR family regulator
MLRDNITDLIAFMAVARERNFTKAAAKLGVSQSALSHTIRDLEERLGLRLLTRTTRSVSPTAAGMQLLDTIGPRLEEIEQELVAVTDMRDTPAGTVRLTASDHAVDSLVWPKLVGVLQKYPDIQVEIVVDYGLTDIVAGQFDAGIRYGETISNGMVAVRIGPDEAFAIVAAPSYFAAHKAPLEPQDLTQHRCINLRLPTHGGLYAWEFEKDGKEVRVRVSGQLVFNGIMQVLQAALDGFGLAFMPENLARPYLEDGRLVRALEDWCPAFSGYHIYYPSRRQPSQAFTIVLDALREKS